jgi:2-polyprenyl-6-methoxyphenol hydroxylase-like FAD-dependent oxidoreductase
MSERCDVAIVGAGIGGSALACALRAAGLGVLLLEREERYVDRVRGEWIAPWGVAEARALGLYETMREAGGHHLARHITFDEVLDPAVARATPIPLDAMRAGVPGPLCIGHPHLCQTLSEEARARGAKLIRGAEKVAVEAGAAPRVRWRDRDGDHEATARLVVGADGRSSSVRRQIGLALESAPAHHLFTGLLVEGAHAWPEDLQAIATEGDLAFLAFPQGRGRVRLYGGYALAQGGRFAGPEGPQRFLDACRLRCLPETEAFASAKPAGPCRSYPNQDTWSARPFVPGVVLIGDAAGYNDPILGQGLSITLRDVRVVCDLLLEHRDWSEATFAPYAEERSERMRRLRFAAAVQSRLDVEFDEAARERRARLYERIAAEPLLAVAVLSSLAGPEVLPAEAFGDEAARRIFGETIPGIAA